LFVYTGTVSVGVAMSEPTSVCWGGSNQVYIVWKVTGMSPTVLSR